MPLTLNHDIVIICAQAAAANAATALDPDNATIISSDEDEASVAADSDGVASVADASECNSLGQHRGADQ